MRLPLQHLHHQAASEPVSKPFSAGLLHSKECAHQQTYNKKTRQLAVPAMLELLLRPCLSALVGHPQSSPEPSLHPEAGPTNNAENIILRQLFLSHLCYRKRRDFLTTSLLLPLSTSRKSMVLSMSPLFCSKEVLITSGSSSVNIPSRTSQAALKLVATEPEFSIAAKDTLNCWDCELKEPTPFHPSHISEKSI